MKSSPYSMKTHTLPDEAVVKRIINGEKELFEILLRRYNQKLFRVVRSYVPTQEIAEDLLQETYIKSYRKLHQFDQRSSYATWLIRIGINEAKQWLRRHEKTKPWQQSEQEELKIIQLPDTNYNEPDRLYQKQELKMTIDNAIDQLPEKYRVIFVLHQSEDMSNRKIAECLQLTEGNVKVRLHRAKNLLKEILIKEARGENIFEFGNASCDRLTERVMRAI